MSASSPIRRVTRSPSETRALGAAIASAVRPGDVLLLVGELGSGKTTFTKGLVGALDPDVVVTSPTFTLCHRYETDPPVAHVDCFRVEPSDDLADLALDELIDEGCVTVIEWGERARALVGEALVIAFSPDERAGGDPSGVENRRRIEIDASGAGWLERVDGLARLSASIGATDRTSKARRLRARS